MFASLLLIAAVHALPESAQAPPSLTAEWIASRSAVIAVATPMDVESYAGEGEAWYTRVRFRLNEVVKGPQSPGDTITVFARDLEKKDRSSLLAGSGKTCPLLIFCDVAPRSGNAMDGSTFSYTDRNGTLMIVLTKVFGAGTTVQIPQVAWTGTLVLVPPVPGD